MEVELAQTQSALEQSSGVLDRLNAQLEQLVSESPLLRQELERKIHLAQAKRDCAQRLVGALEAEQQASSDDDAAANTSRARAHFAASQDQAKVAELVNWQRDEPRGDLLQTYQSLCDLHSPASRPQRQALGEFLASEKVPLPQLEVLAVTWNMGNAAPNPLDLDKLIPMRAGNRLYDLVVVGAQECGFDLSPAMLEKATRFRTQVKREAKIVLQQAIVPHPEDAAMDEPGAAPPHLLPKFVTTHFRAKVEKLSKRAVTSRAGDYFASLISDHLNPEDYLLLRLCEFSNMRLYAFVRREHAQRVSHIDYASQSTGVGGIAGNKGAVAVSFRFQQFRLCFISCHMAAHRKFTKERNSDCAEVLAMLQRKLGAHSVSYLSDWDFVFLLGDLNYRLNLSDAPPSPPAPTAAGGEGVEQFNKIRADHTEQERAQVVDMIARSQWAELLALDQLRAEQAKGNALVGFQEAAVYPFAPTFKVVDRANADWNLRYANNRLPAYCDRILWYATPGMRLYQGHERVAQADLFSPEHMTTSDHDPVCSRFLVNLAGDSQRLTGGSDVRAKLAKSATGLAASLSLPSTLMAQGGAGMQIVFWDLQATGLLSQDSTGTSDPYVVAYSPELFPEPKQRGSSPLLGASRTGVKFLTLNCRWKDTMLVVQAPNRFATPNSLRGRHVTLCVRDFDFSSYDDSMGEAVVLLDDLVSAFEACGKTTGPPFVDASTPGAVQLRLAILLNGKRAGEMTGLAALCPSADRVKASRSNSDYMWKGRALMESYTQRF